MKMVNKTQKMRVTNMKVRKWLLQNGYKDIHLFPHTRWSKDVHFRGLEFDGIASLGTRLVLFQVKTNRKPSKEMQEQYKLISKESSIICLWFNRVDRKGLEIYPKNEKD